MRGRTVAREVRSTATSWKFRFACVFEFQIPVSCVIDSTSTIIANEGSYAGDHSDLWAPGSSPVLFLCSCVRVTALWVC